MSNRAVTGGNQRETYLAPLNDEPESYSVGSSIISRFQVAEQGVLVEYYILFRSQGQRWAWSIHAFLREAALVMKGSVQAEFLFAGLRWQMQ